MLTGYGGQKMEVPWWRASSRSFEGQFWISWIIFSIIEINIAEI